MENLFANSEEIVYKEIIGDPVYDIYYDDNINFINYQLSRDVAVNQSQSMISREDVHVCSHSKPIEEGVFVRSMDISGVLSLYHNEYMKIKFQILVMCFATVDVKIKLMVQKIYILLFDGYYRWKAKEKEKYVCHGQGFGIKDHG